MKTLTAIMFCFYFLPHLPAQEKEIHQTYYSYKSTCYFTCTESTTAILTMYKDSSFIFETYTIRYSDSSSYAGMRFSGNWNMMDGRMELHYNAEFAKEKSPQFGVTYLPYKCYLENENLRTDSKSFPQMFMNFGKTAALGEKCRYEQHSQHKKQLIYKHKENIFYSRIYSDLFYPFLLYDVA